MEVRGCLTGFASNVSPIFQNEEIIVGSLVYDFEDHELEMINENLNLEITLYYTNGVQTATLNLQEVYKETFAFNKTCS